MTQIRLASHAYNCIAFYEISCHEHSLFSILVSVDLDINLRRGVFG